MVGLLLYTVCGLLWSAFYMSFAQTNGYWNEWVMQYVEPEDKTDKMLSFIFWFCIICIAVLWPFFAFLVLLDGVSKVFRRR